jgi:hypothetical protein
MIFFMGGENKAAKNAKNKKLLKKLKKKQYEAYCRRQHLIIEARKSHERNRKEIHKSKGGWGSTTTMEQENLGFAVAEGITKTIVMSGNAMARLKSRRKSLDKSRKTHLDKLKKARATAKKRAR